MKAALITLWIIAISSNLLATPADGLKSYYSAMEKNDKKMLREAIDAPEAYKDQFVKMLDVAKRMSILTELLNQKYEIPAKERKDVGSYLQALSKDLLNRKFEINGDRAKTIPKNANEISVDLVRIDKKWRLDMRKGQSDQNLLAQAVIMGKNYDAITALLNGFIAKIDTLDTKKHSHSDAWKMINTQISRKLQSISKEAQKNPQ